MKIPISQNPEPAHVVGYALQAAIHCGEAVATMNLTGSTLMESTYVRLMLPELTPLYQKVMRLLPIHQATCRAVHRT